MDEERVIWVKRRISKFTVQFDVLDAIINRRWMIYFRDNTANLQTPLAMFNLSACVKYSRGSALQMANRINKSHPPAKTASRLHLKAGYRLFSRRTSGNLKICGHAMFVGDITRVCRWHIVATLINRSSSIL